MPENITAAIESVGSSSSGLFAGTDWKGILVSVLIALALLIVCIIVKNLLMRLLDKGLGRSHIEKSIHAFLRSAVKVILWFVIIMIVAGSLGIDTNSLLAVLGIAGLAVSLSVQNSLANLASGISILVTKPFVVGDYVQIGAEEGTVLEIGMVYTKLNTLDHRRVIIPNSTVASDRVTNYATEPKRRVDIMASASYDAPVEQVKEALLTAVSAHPMALSDPAPMVRLSAYQESTIQYTVRVWCENKNYWDLYFDLMELVKKTFDEKGIAMSYPHVQVHMLPQ